MNLERRSDPFRRPAHGVAERWTNAGSEGRIDGSDWPARTGSVLPSLDTTERSVAHSVCSVVKLSTYHATPYALRFAEDNDLIGELRRIPSQPELVNSFSRLGDSDISK